MSNPKTMTLKGKDIIACEERGHWATSDHTQFYIRIPCDSRPELHALQNELAKLRDQ